MFTRLHDRGTDLAFDFEGETIRARDGETVAAALLAAGVGATRETPVSGAGRAAHCMIGMCFECLVEIDGRPNRQACLTPVRAGMRVRRQTGAARIVNGEGA